MGFEYSHAYSTPVKGTDSGGSDEPTVVVSNPLSTKSAPSSVTFNVSAPWIQAGNDGVPNISTGLASQVVAGSTSLAISDASGFISGYPNVHQNGVALLLPEIGRVSGDTPSGSSSINLIISSQIPKSFPFNINVNGQVLSVTSTSTSSVSGAIAFNLSATTTIDIPDLSPVHNNALDTSSSYNVIDTPTFYVTSSISAGTPTPYISTSPLPCDIPSGTTIALTFDDYIETCIVGESAMAGDTQLSLASFVFNGVGTGVASIVMTSGTTTTTTFAEEMGNTGSSTTFADTMNMGMGMGMSNDGSNASDSILGIETGTVLFGGLASAAIVGSASTTQTNSSLSFSSGGSASSSTSSASSSATTIQANILVVGGGGGSGGSLGAGGGGGSVFEGATTIPIGTPISFNVGSGGGLGNNGASSGFQNNNANGGFAGTLKTGGASGNNNSGGGMEFADSGTGGGGGATGAGGQGYGHATGGTSVGGAGGAGYTTTIVNTGTVYGAGGGGWAPDVSGSGGTGQANAGGGGNYGTAGKTGLVVLVVPSSAPTATWTGITPTVSTVGSTTVYTWSVAGAGTVTFGTAQPSGSSGNTTGTTLTGSAAIGTTTVTFTNLIPTSSNAVGTFQVQVGQALIGEGIPPNTFVVGPVVQNGTSGTFNVSQPVSFTSGSASPNVYLASVVSSTVTQGSGSQSTFVIMNSSVGATAETSYFGSYIPSYNFDASTGANGVFTTVNAQGMVALNSDIVIGQPLSLYDGESFIGTIANGTSIISSVMTMNGIDPGQVLSAKGIPYGTTVVSTGTNSNGFYIEMSAPATSTETQISILAQGANQTVIASASQSRLSPHISVEPFTPDYAFDNSSILIAPYSFTLDSGDNIEIVYPVTLPISMNSSGKAPFSINLASRLRYNHANGASLLYYAMPSPPDPSAVIYRPDLTSVSGKDIYAPFGADTHELAIYDKTSFIYREARIDSIQGLYTIKGSPNGGDKTNVYFNVIGEEGPPPTPDQIPNADVVSGKLYTGGVKSLDPKGDPWTPSSFNNLQLEVEATVPPNGSITYKSISVKVGFQTAPLPTTVHISPSDSVTLSPETTSTIDWTFSDLDGAKQSAFVVNVFDQFTYSSLDFAPDTSKPVWSVTSNDVDAEATSVSFVNKDGSTPPLISGQNYWAFVKVAKTLNKDLWFGDWASTPFTAVVLQPQPALVSYNADSTNSLNSLIIQASENILKDDNAEFANSIGSWSATNNDNTSVQLLDGETGTVLSSALSSKQQVSSISIGGTGYLVSPLSLNASTGSQFLVSGKSGSKTQATQFPAVGTTFWVIIGSESILVNHIATGTSKTASTFQIVERGYRNTTASLHTENSAVVIGLQEDIYAGTVGKLYFVVPEVKATTKKQYLPATSTSVATGSSNLMSSAGTVLRVTVPTSSSKPNQFTVLDVNNALDPNAKSWPTFTISTVVKTNKTTTTSTTRNTSKNGNTTVSFSETQQNSNLVANVVSIKSVKATSAVSSSEAIQITQVSRTVSNQGPNTGIFTPIFSLPVNPVTPPPNGGIPNVIYAGTTLVVFTPGSSDPSSKFNVTLTKDWKVASDTSIWFKPIRLYNNSYYGRSNNCFWYVGAGAAISIVAKVTKPSNLKVVTLESGWNKQTGFSNYVIKNAIMLNMQTPGNGLPTSGGGGGGGGGYTSFTTPAIPAKPQTQKFTVAKQTYGFAPSFNFTSGTFVPIVFTANTTMNSPSITAVSGNYGSLVVGSGVSGTNIPSGTTVVGVNGTSVTLSNPVTSTSTNESITSNSFVSISGITSTTAVTANQFAGYLVDAYGVIPGTSIFANSACSANSTFTITLSRGMLLQDTTTLTSISFDSEFNSANLGNIILAGATSISVDPFTPNFDYPTGSAVTLHYPSVGTTNVMDYESIYGQNIMMLQPENNGYIEISTKGNSSPSTFVDDPDTCSVTPGNTYGLMGWSNVINGLSTPLFQPYILWYDSFGNFIYQDSGNRSLNTPQIKIATISANGSMATVTTVGAHGLSNGQQVIIWGNSFTSLDAYNQTQPQTVFVISPTQFYFTTSYTGTGVGGVASVLNNISTSVMLNNIPASPLAQTSATSTGWVPNAIVAVAPENFIVANQASFQQEASNNSNYAGSFFVQSGTNIALNAGTEVTASANGFVYVVAENVPIGSTVIPVIFGPSGETSATFSAFLIKDSTTISQVNSGYFYAGQPVTGAGIPSNTYVVSVNPDRSLTLSNPVQADGTFTLTSYGNSTNTTTDLTISATVAVPAFGWSNAVGTDTYGLAAVIFKALTPPTPTGYTAVNSLIPELPISISNSTIQIVNNAIPLPATTPTNGYDSFYLFDPCGDFGTRELQIGAESPILWATTTADANAGDTSIAVSSIAGLTPSAEILLDWGGISEETAIVSSSWDGSTNVALVSPLQYSHTSGAQVYAVVSGIAGQLQNVQSAGTPVAVFTWNNAGWIGNGSVSSDYYFSVQRSDDSGTTWTPLPNNGNVTLDKTGKAEFVDYFAVPGSETAYKVQGYYVDTVANATITGVPTPPLLAPMGQTQTWWLSSFSRPDLYHFPVNVQNGLQEEQKHPVGVFYPLGSSRPYAIAGTVQGRDATIDIVWKDTVLWPSFVEMLNRGEVLVLIDPVEQERRYIFISDNVTATHNSGSGGPWRDVKLTYVETAPPNFGYTYGS